MASRNMFDWRALWRETLFVAGKIHVLWRETWPRLTRCVAGKVNCGWQDTRSLAENMADPRNLLCKHSRLARSVARKVGRPVGLGHTGRFACSVAGNICGYVTWDASNWFWLDCSDHCCYCEGGGGGGIAWHGQVFFEEMYELFNVLFLLPLFLLQWRRRKGAARYIEQFALSIRQNVIILQLFNRRRSIDDKLRGRGLYSIWQHSWTFKAHLPITHGLVL